jgi:Fe-S-cluster containining protein
VREDGCLVYVDRPTTCRYYPLGVASLSHKDGARTRGWIFTTGSMPNGRICWSENAHFPRI